MQKTVLLSLTGVVVGRQALKGSNEFSGQLFFQSLKKQSEMIHQKITDEAAIVQKDFFYEPCLQSQHSGAWGGGL